MNMHDDSTVQTLWFADVPAPVLKMHQRLDYAGRTEAEGPYRRPTVRVNVAGGAGEQIRATLATRGGVPSYSRAECLYDFPTEADRAEALEAVRRHFGWTCVDPL